MTDFDHPRQRWAPNVHPARRSLLRGLEPVSIEGTASVGTAAGFSAGRVFQARQGDSADVPGKNRRCSHYLRYIDYFTGDARSEVAAL